MSTDRELVGLAANAMIAAGQPLIWARNHDEHEPYWMLDFEPWFPLNDDGDALRLAAVLRLDLVFCSDEVSVMGVDDTSLEYFDEPYGNDRMAATRRAIVRAAAEIGRAMP